MHPIIGQLGGITIYSHGLLIIFAVIIASFLMYYLIGRSGLSKKNFIDNVSTVILVGVLGARLAYDIIYYNQLESFWQAFYIWQGGLVSWGGIIFGALAFILLIRFQKQPILKWLDIFAIAGVVGIAIGRIGCLMAGDIFGKTTSVYPRGFPVAGYEIVLDFFLAAILLFLYFRNKNLKPGVIFYEAVAGYGLIRFVLDAYRDAPTYFLDLNSGQITAGLVLIVIILFFIVQFLYRRRNEQK